MDERADDLGHVIRVMCYGHGARSAMGKAERTVLGLGKGWTEAHAFRATLRDDNPEPEEYPSLFEVLVRVE